MFISSYHSHLPCRCWEHGKIYNSFSQEVKSLTTSFSDKWVRLYLFWSEKHMYNCAFVKDYLKLSIFFFNSIKENLQRQGETCVSFHCSKGNHTTICPCFTNALSSLKLPNRYIPLWPRVTITVTILDQCHQYCLQ